MKNTEDVPQSSAMKLQLLPLLLALGFSACSTYHPLRDDALRHPIGHAPASKSAVTVTFLGNTTLHIRDGETSLLVDGFLSRPGLLKTFLWQIGPDSKVIHEELDRAGIGKVDAVLVGHAHHDHALDATMIADCHGAHVVGSESFAQIYRGSHEPGSPGKLSVVPKDGDIYTFGRFTVTFAPSDHVSSLPGLKGIPQRAVEGCIKTPLKMPAYFSEFKCGEVFALHIAHPEGEIVVTTTAGAKPGQLRGKHADVLFLGVGLLSKESPRKQETYWRETVGATHPDVIVPVHWDNFTRKLSSGLKPSALAEDPRAPMTLVKQNAGTREVRVLDRGETVTIHHGHVFIPPPK